MNTSVEIAVWEHSSGAEFVRRAEALTERIRDRAAEGEALRRLPDQTVKDFMDAEFHRMCQPKRFGGYGLGPDAALGPVMTLARSCGSSGWVANLMAIHNWQISMFPVEAQEEYWADSQDVLASTAAFSVQAKVEDAEGGVYLSGRWKFASGADFASWFIIMQPQPGVFDWMLVHKDEVKIVDDWFVSGLCATGSKDIVLDRVFVPSHRIVQAADLHAGSTEGALLYSSPYYRVPFYSVAPMGLAGAVIGMAEGLTMAFENGLMGKRSLMSGQLQTERVSNQIKLAEAMTDVKVAKMLLLNAAVDVGYWGEYGIPKVEAEQLEPRRDVCYAVRNAVSVARSLSIAAGANSTYHKSPIQRFVRDILAGGSHAGLAYEDAAEAFGRARWDQSLRGAGEGGKRIT